MQTYTDPYTGTYSLRLPSEAEYTLSISAEYPGLPHSQPHRRG